MNFNFRKFINPLLKLKIVRLCVKIWHRFYDPLPIYGKVIFQTILWIPKIPTIALCTFLYVTYKSWQYFQELDTNHDYQLDPDEFEHAESSMDFEEVDLNHNGKINFNEFRKAGIEKKTIS